MQNYRITFLAIDPGPLDDETPTRLTEALEGMPGPTQPGDARLSEGAVGASFTIDVRHAMADAARDGSRLAKEALKSAGMPDAKLIDLHVVLEGPAT